MLKFIAFFAILAVVFAAPKPEPVSLTYSSEIPLAYTHIGAPIGYTNLEYNIPYASGYNYYGAPLAYKNLYF